MDARSKTVTDILHTGDQYIVPLFQRSYSWQKSHWERLNADIMALVEDPERQVHFLGPLVCTPSKHIPGNVPTYQLIDGQQRLTTLTVILAVIRDVARARGQGDLADEITEDFLVHKRRQDMERIKVLPRIGDRDALMAIVEGGDLTPFSSLRLVHAWRYFRRQILHRTRRDPKTELRNLFDTVTRRLSLVVITIDGENPYEIFESLNATGLALAESDLIRNYVFMQVAMNEQDAFDRNHWRPLEQCFDLWGGERAEVITGFYRDYLMRDGRYSREKSTFVDFKAQMKDRGVDAPQQATELRHFAPLAVQIRKPGTCNAKTVRQALEQVEKMDIGTAYALVLHLLDRHAKGTLAEAELCTCLNDLVSFVLRRTVCGESTRAYGRWFVEAIGAAGQAPAANLRKYWIDRGWPDDAAVSRALVDFAFYKREPRKARMVLEVLERSIGHKEQIVLSDLNIEHVMPQTITNDAAGRAWQTALGQNWKDVHESCLHVLGNLTLTGYNPELGKMPFAEKQGLYRDSHVELNRCFRKLTTWDEEGIRKRTAILADMLCKQWPRPASAPPYAGEVEEETDNHGKSPAQLRNMEYWRLFLKQWSTRATSPAPEPSETGELVFPLTAAGDIAVHLWLFRRERKQVAFVKFDGRAAGRLYAQLQETKQELDDLIESDLDWDWPNRNCFAVCEEDIDFGDRNDWELQHAWFCEELEDIVQALTPQIEQWEQEEEPDDEPEGCERQQLRIEFWTGLLAYAKTRTPLHADRKPWREMWINGSIGKSGFSLNYVIREKDAQVELYIDLGQGKDESNKRALAALRQHQREIEEVFGGPLEWQELPDKRASRIRKIVEGGWRSPHEDWPATHKAMVDAMIRLDKAVRPFVQKLKV